MPISYQRLAAAAVLLFLLALAACSSSPSNSTQPKIAAAAASPSPSATEQVATVRQYASAVSPPIKSLRKTWAGYDANGCGVKNDPTDLACGLAPTTLNMETQTLVLTMIGAAKPGAPAYIGKPPAELEKLILDTVDAAQGLTDVTDPNHKGTSPQVFMAGSKLMTVLDRWDPYLGGAA
jgi:hypothetical protein